ncbi:ABC transporter substrate-binding protein [Streptomyces tsukubensis]|uniref:ABC transporter substrate-binding protein n=1 Tax=Streptomyces tsukubensis TaxID=83656 RepID=UPI0036ABC78F
MTDSRRHSPAAGTAAGATPGIARGTTRGPETDRTGSPAPVHRAPRPRRPRSGPAAAAALAGTLLLTGCGALPGLGDDPDRITVMTFAPEGTDATNMPGMPAMAKAYARWANATGGIDGHELRVITCNEGDTPSGASDCARQAVREKADAVVGSYSQHGNAFLAPLQAASIPYIGGYGISDDEFSSVVSYPVNAGQAALLAGQGVQLADECRRVAIVRPDTAAGDSLPQLLGSGLAHAGRPAPRDILAPDNATGYAREAARARDLAGAGAEGSSDERPGCVTAALGERTETFVDSYRRLPDDGREIRFSSVSGSVDQPLINRTGGRQGPYEGAFVTGWYPGTDDSRWDLMKKVIGEHAFGDDRIDPADAGVQTTWIAYSVLASAIRAVNSDTVDSRRIIQALDSGTEVTTGGLTPTLNWRFADLTGFAGYPRAANRSVTFHVVRGGRLVSQGKGIDDIGKIL